MYLGRVRVFYRALTRKPLPKRSDVGASGPHKGLETQNIDWRVASLCFDGERLDVQMYLALHTRIDYDGLCDLEEIREVQVSWQNAFRMNAQLKSGG